MKSIDIKIGSTNEYHQYIEDAKKKKIQLVCVASIQEESYCAKLYKELIVAKDQLNRFASLIEKVNRGQGVGCLYSIANLSIIPQYDYNDQKNVNKIKHDLREIIYQANEKLMKTDTIVFLLDNNTLSYNILSKNIKEIFSDNKTPLECLQTIILC